MAKNKGVVDRFTSGEVAGLTGLNYRTIDYWARTGLIVPSIAPGTGTGKERLYSIKDVRALRVADRLRQQGVSTRLLRRVVDELRSQGSDNPLAENRLVVMDGDVIRVASRKEILSLLKAPNQWTFGFILKLGDVAELPESTSIVALPEQSKKTASAAKKTSRSALRKRAS